MDVLKRRWHVFAIFFVFMLLHQSDKLLIGPLTESIQLDFGLNNTQMGAVSTGALIVGAICYPLWGYFYDRYSRPKLLALASLIWGATTWLSSVVTSYPAFVATRASTGIDDSSYPGLYSLISDYFGPKLRGRIFGLLELTAPLGYLIGMILAMLLGGVIGWRSIFYITGSLGIVLAVVIFFGVKDVPRGQSEPEFENREEIAIYKFKWSTARDLFKKPGLLLMFAQGFFGVFPWNVITYWIFKYLSTERHFNDNQVLMTMVPAVLVLAIGYPIGGALGDWLFKRTSRGRLIVATGGVLMGALMLFISLNIPIENTLLFSVMFMLTALFIPFAAPNVISTVYDVTLPEVRSSALAVQYFIESAGAASAPLLAGIISDNSSLQSAMLIICITAWILCGIAFFAATFFVPKEIKALRNSMKERAESSLPAGQ